MNLTRPSSWAGNRHGMAATLLIVVVLVLLAALTFVNANTVRRARRETELLDARQQRQWRQRGMEAAAPVVPNRDSATTDTPRANPAP